MFVVLVALAIKAVLAQNPKHIKYELGIQNLLRDLRPAGKILQKFEERRYSLKPSDDMLYIRFRPEYRHEPTVVRIKFNNQTIYQSFNNTNRSPEFNAEGEIQFKPYEDVAPADYEELDAILHKELWVRVNPPALEIERCGTVKLRHMPFHTIAESTLDGQWPWHALIYRYEEMNLYYICGGSLISLKHILTAAHCVTEIKRYVKIKKELLQISLGHEQIKGVSNITLHPNYNERNWYNDIAILELDSAVKISDYVRKICLWDEDITIHRIRNTFGTVVGYNYNGTGYVGEELLQEVTLIVDRKSCINLIRDYFYRFPSDNILCGRILNNRTACVGDPGSGLYFRRADSYVPIWQLRGIVTVRFCTSSKYIVFTDVIYYLDWIKAIID